MVLLEEVQGKPIENGELGHQLRYLINAFWQLLIIKRMK